MNVQKYSQAPVVGAAVAAGRAGEDGRGIGGTARIYIIVIVVLAAADGVAAVVATLVIQSKTLHTFCAARCARHCLGLVDVDV